MIQVVRTVGAWFAIADYFKTALGYFQLASMTELAIVIQNLISQMKLVRKQSLEIYTSQRRNNDSVNIDIKIVSSPTIY